MKYFEWFSILLSASKELKRCVFVRALPSIDPIERRSCIFVDVCEGAVDKKCLLLLLLVINILGFLT